MVRAFFNRIATPIRGFNKAAYLRIISPIRGLHQAAYLLALLTLASQLLALLRDRTFAHTFGVGHVLDLYYAAFRVPDLVFALVSSLVSAYVLIPRLSGMTKEETKHLLSESTSFLLVMGGIICILLGIFMPQFLSLLYPRFASDPEFILLSRILLIQPILLGLSGVLGSVTQVHRRFVLFALSPVLYNIGIIIGITVLYPIWGLSGIGIGVIAGAIGYLCINAPVIIEAGVVPRFVIPKWTSLKTIVHDSIPRSLALGMGSITALLLTALASRLGTGAVSVFTFAGNLAAVPLALIGSSYAVAAFPALSEASALEKREEFTNILSASARHIILWSLVSLGIIAVLRAHIVRVILGTGAFDWNATRLTAALLALLTVGLAAQGLILLFSRALYAVKQSWRPFFYQIAGGIFTILLAEYFLHGQLTSQVGWLGSFLKVTNVDGTSILLIASASAIGQIVLAGLSLWSLEAVTPGLARTLTRSLVDGSLAAVSAGFAAYAVLLVLGGIAPLTSLLVVFANGFIAGCAGLLAAALALYYLENEEFTLVVGALQKLMLRRSAVLEPSAEEPAQP